MVNLDKTYTLRELLKFAKNRDDLDGEYPERRFESFSFMVDLLGVEFDEDGVRTLKMVMAEIE